MPEHRGTRWQTGTATPGETASLTHGAGEHGRERPEWWHRSVASSSAFVGTGLSSQTTTGDAHSAKDNDDD